ncbi:hypothetical protein FDP41_012131 [Naegleria fowleri]|uniref:Uncharacterized protein n=1 Tax=Naegleria fowleri TaxID=5763 RepID=A0A6A5C4T7_NAEFO|nr:uncharacterized protein FDP41_012131 [Naegleria fowleri]KAF0981474.1 hypothetical protein FDP41_012131 [Naegleria fowleri]CAG4714794.1 unnamed protein product [Naegleria fowleri]
MESSAAAAQGNVMQESSPTLILQPTPPQQPQPNTTGRPPLLTRRLSLLNQHAPMERVGSEANLMMIRKNKHHSTGSSLIINSTQVACTTSTPSCSSSPQSPTTSPTSPTHNHCNNINYSIIKNTNTNNSSATNGTTVSFSFKNGNNQNSTPLPTSSPRGNSVSFSLPQTKATTASTSSVSNDSCSLPPLVPPPRSSSLPPLQLNPLTANSFSNSLLETLNSSGASGEENEGSPSSPSSISSTNSSSLSVSSQELTFVNRRRSSGSFGLVMEQLSSRGSPISPHLQQHELHGRTRMRIDLENTSLTSPMQTPDKKLPLSRLLHRRNSFAMNGVVPSPGSQSPPSSSTTPSSSSVSVTNGGTSHNNVSPRNSATLLHPHSQQLHVSKSDSEIAHSVSDLPSPTTHSKDHSERLPILVHHHSLRIKEEKDFSSIFCENEQAMKDMEQFSPQQGSPRLNSSRNSVVTSISSPRNSQVATNNQSPSSAKPKKPSLDRLIESFSEIQDQKKELKKDPLFQQHMKEFSTHVRAYNTRCILSEQEILEFISDQRDFPDELDPNILSKASNKDVKWYVTTLGEKTVNMLCEWKYRLNYLESECKDMKNFSEVKQKIEQNIKRMKETLGSLAATTAAEHLSENESIFKESKDGESTKQSTALPLKKGRSKSLISNISYNSKQKNTL